MSTNAKPLAEHHRWLVHRPLVAEQYLVGDAERAHLLFEKRRQQLGATPPGRSRMTAPVRGIAAVEMYLVHQMAGGRKPVGQPLEKRRADTLQEQEMTLTIHRRLSPRMF